MYIEFNKFDILYLPTVAESRTLKKDNVAPT